MAIISLHHNLIFIKTTKTAGTSIEVDLARHLGPGAVVTPIIPPVVGHEPRNYRSPNGERRYYNHMKASEIRDLLGDEAYRSFYRFTVEREPVDKCLSHFHMLKNRNDEHGLSEQERATLTWSRYVEQGRFPIDVTKYRDPDRPGELLVDTVLAYETLASDLPVLLDAQGLTGFALTSRIKSSYRARPHAAQEDVTPAQRTRIYEHFAETRALTGLYQ